MRGNRQHGTGFRQGRRSIPARAGEPRRRPCSGARRGSIPARAGEPRRSTPVRPCRGVYPRACRGNRRVDPHGRRRTRSIPARAGEPLCKPALRRASPVYPRACGGTREIDPAPDAKSGLSPRVRGNQRNRPRPRRQIGSIPARAGEPRGLIFFTDLFQVYPRACGGTPWAHLLHRPFPGLSPRVRGNPCQHSPAKSMPGSIPARAGEPLKDELAKLRDEVYPRACGGTIVLRLLITHPEGLSPRVRGNRFPRSRRAGSCGSIPARAGEPPPCVQPPPCGPRACGGTEKSAATSRRPPGLSPRVRGNPIASVNALTALGSIPARAGEPTRCGRQLGLRWVYPRACGGTTEEGTGIGTINGLSPRVRGNRDPGIGVAVHFGLSPRVRGNHLDEAVATKTVGSIPARAGEPWRRRRTG